MAILNANTPRQSTKSRTWIAATIAIALVAPIAAIRALEPSATILVISALNSHRDAIEAIRRGACGFLTKPFTADEVVDAIRLIAEHSRRDRS